MAIFRKIHTSFWSDPFTSELDNDKKLFYLYLLTNERTKQCGIYEISIRQIQFDLNIKVETVKKYIDFFSKTGKIMFSDNTNEIAIKNWVKFNYSTSPKVIKCIESELKNVKNRVLIEYINCIDTLSQEEEEEEQEEEEYINAKSIDFDRLLDYINLTFDKNFKSINDKAKKSFNARLKNYNKEIFITVINNLKKDTYHLETNFKYITPEYISREKTIDLHSQDVKQQTKIDNPYNLSPAQLESSRIAELQIAEAIKQKALENDSK